MLKVSVLIVEKFDVEEAQYNSVSTEEDSVIDFTSWPASLLMLNELWPRPPRLIIC